MASTILLILSCFIAAFAVILIRRLASPRLYPPGPPGKFLIGNLKDIPTNGNSEWTVYQKMGEKLGSDIIYLNALGSHLLVINSFDAARDLLEKKSSLYSSRPRLVLINELLGWDWNLILMAYSKTFNAYRRVVQQAFQPAVVTQSYRSVMEDEIVSFLGRLLASPQDLIKHIKHMTGAMIMMVTYGHQVTSANDKYVALAEAVREHGEQIPVNSAIEAFPILKYVPAWFPGARLQKEALYGRKLSADMRNAPFDMVKTRLTSSQVVAESIVGNLIQSDLATGGVDREEFIKNCGGVVYSAGADTTVAALSNFFLAMTWYPEVQKKAQEELDRVVGRDRLPGFADRSRLPYIGYVVKESLRWKPVAPLAVPHSTVEEDEYRGMYIPKSTTVLPNIYAILHDKAVYNNPDDFHPERFAPSEQNPGGEPDPARAVFGFGRRICPGRFFADDSLWLTIASTLHLICILKPADAAETKVTWASGLVSNPSSFPFEISPRFPGAHDLVISQHGL